jgi:hypothetical protein
MGIALFYAFSAGEQASLFAQIVGIDISDYRD